MNFDRILFIISLVCLLPNCSKRYTWPQTFDPNLVIEQPQPLLFFTYPPEISSYTSMINYSSRTDDTVTILSLNSTNTVYINIITHSLKDTTYLLDGKTGSM